MTAPSILNLVDDCFDAIFEHLSIDDLSSLGDCCHRLRILAQSHFERRHGSKFVIMESTTERVLRIFGHSMQNILLAPDSVIFHNSESPFSMYDHRKILSLIRKYCTNVNKVSITLENFNHITRSMVGYHRKQIKWARGNFIYANTVGNNMRDEESLDTLNDKCLLAIMDYVPLNDLAAMADCSKRLRAVSRQAFQKRSEYEPMQNAFALDYSVSPRVLRVFGDLIEHISLNCASNYIRYDGVMIKFESADLRMIRCAARYMLNVTKLSFVDISEQTFSASAFRHLIRNVIDLQLSMCVVPNPNQVVKTMQCCPLLERLSIEGRVDCSIFDPFLMTVHPHLKAISIDGHLRCNYTFVRFCRNNSQLEEIVWRTKSRCPTTNGCIRLELSNLKYLRRLRKLQITRADYMPVSEKVKHGRDLVEVMQHCTSLTHLDVQQLTPWLRCATATIQSVTFCRIPCQGINEHLSSVLRTLPNLRACEIPTLCFYQIQILLNLCAQMETIYLRPSKYRHGYPEFKRAVKVVRRFKKCSKSIRIVEVGPRTVGSAICDLPITLRNRYAHIVTFERAQETPF